MNPQILCNWLGIANWPPDHYTLLGLKPGEADPARIEHQVQERMAKLRCYQLSHPEEATEGMNRIAQAFIQLTDISAKNGALETADAKTANGLASPAKPAPSPAETQELQRVGHRTAVDWQTPPPVRTPGDSGVVAPAPQPAPPSPPPSLSPVDPIYELAHESSEARRGLRTLPDLIERIHQTRQLLLAWNHAGKYLNKPHKKLSKNAEEIDLARRLNKIFELSAEFPKILGHPGQPGYRVVAMARLDMTAQMFKMLDKDQREALAQDWQNGYKVLLAHRQFLRKEFKVLRRRGFLSLVMRAIRTTLNDHPVWVSLGVLLGFVLCALVISNL